MSDLQHKMIRGSGMNNPNRNITEILQAARGNEILVKVFERMLHLEPEVGLKIIKFVLDLEISGLALLYIYKNICNESVEEFMIRILDLESKNMIMKDFLGDYI